jgi:AbrB family looped-hinge helix DNA binding protein
MLAKLTSKNQITIPKKIMDQLQGTKHFDVELKDGTIVLKPVRLYDVDLKQIRMKMKSLGIEQNTVAEAIQWARNRER